MNAMGHNESAVRLATLVGDVQIALDKVARGEADAIEGWLAYGAALNEGRALFPGDKEFGEWVTANALSQLATAEIDRNERAAAMWAAANADQLAEAKAACNARTIRGWHDQWKKIEQEREQARQKAEREAEQARKREEAAAEAKRLAEVETEARAVAEAATTDDERQEAEARVEQVAEAKAAAEMVVAESAEPEIDPEIRKLMRELTKMTPEAVADEVAGLRADLAEKKATIKRQKVEIASLKSENDLLRQNDLGRALGNAKRRADAAEGRMREHQASAARLQKQVNAQKAEISKLNKQLEAQVIPL